jgi:hypothetical protein
LAGWSIYMNGIEGGYDDSIGYVTEYLESVDYGAFCMVGAWMVAN